MALPVPDTHSVPVSNTASRWLNITMLAMALVLWIVQIGDYFNGTVDDVFITLRVANNVSSGHGYVYNIGENIEGHSNWSWVTLISFVGNVAGVNSASIEMLWISKILALLFSLLSLVIIYALARKLTDSAFFASASILLVSSTATFGFWSICGLETPLVLFLVSLATLLFYHTRRNTSQGYTLYILLGLTLAALAVTRPEGLAYGFLLLVIHYFLDRKISKQLVVVSLCLVIPVLIFLAWRYQTYGMLLPNTYYAKIVSGYRRFILGFKYDLESLLACLGPLLLFLPFAFRTQRHEEHSQRACRDTLILAIAFTVFGFFFAFYSGGDWMPAYRFILPILGLVAVLGICGLQYVYRSIETQSLLTPQRFKYVTVLVLLFSAGSLTFEGRPRTKGQSAFRIPHALSMAPGYHLFDHWETAKWLAAHQDSIKVFAAGEAGILGFLNPQMKLVDLNGLMDTTIARNKINGLDTAYVMDRNPDCVIIYRDPGPGMAVIGSTQSYTDALKSNKRFRENYAMTDSVGVFAIYTRKSTRL